MKGETQVWPAGGACVEGEEEEERCWFSCSWFPCRPSRLDTLPFRRKPLPSGRKSISISKPSDNLGTSSGPNLYGQVPFLPSPYQKNCTCSRLNRYLHSEPTLAARHAGIPQASRRQSCLAGRSARCRSPRGLSFISHSSSNACPINPPGLPYALR